MEEPVSDRIKIEWMLKAGSEVRTARPEVMSKMCMGRWYTSGPDYHLSFERPGLRGDGIGLLVIPESLLYVSTALDGPESCLLTFMIIILPSSTVQNRRSMPGLSSKASAISLGTWIILIYT